MRDPRIAEYATLLVERCLGVQPGWQVMVISTPLARPLVEEVVRKIARRGAYPLVRLSFVDEQVPFDVVWAKEAPEELLSELAPLERKTREELDAWMHIGAPENARDGSDLPSPRRALLSEATHHFTERRLALEIPWVVCRFPTQALAQDAGMTLREFEDFLYGACLLDWDAEREKMQRVAARFEAAKEVRIVDAETDLTLSVEGRTAVVDDGHLNMPGGEFFLCPLEDSAEGVVTYSEFPAVYLGRELIGVRLEFRGGEAVNASSRTNEAFLLETLDRDPGARRLGELGIGCNPGIRRHTKSVLFDEKMDGTVHLALGGSIRVAGGTNESTVHWDMVKDLRGGGRLYCDGELVQEDGRWLI